MPLFPLPPTSIPFRLTGTVSQLAVTQQAGSFTGGVKFLVSESGLTCTGVRFYAVVASSKTFKISIWDAAGVRLTSNTIVVPVTGTYVITFTSPQALTAGAMYRVSMWQTDGANYTKATLSGLIGVVPSRPFFAGLATIVDVSLFLAGDSAPTSAAATEAYLLEPLF